MKNTIEIAGKDILINGVATQIRSGAMHYFRIHPDYWRDRLMKLKQCGLNTVETYFAWNFHEPREGEYDFSGWRDVVSFIKLAQELGLMVIARPGPFICSEWDFGGIPSWLLSKPPMRIRCMNPVWLEAVDRYFATILPMLHGLQWTQGGPIIMMQIDNEYGSVGNDVEYIRHLYQLHIDAGFDIPMFISDSISSTTALSGGIPETLLTGNGRRRPVNFLNTIQALRPGVPEIVMELWSGVSHKWTQSGWLTHDPEDVRVDVESLMERKASFNFYMFHGGTSFGYYPGAVSDGSKYLPYLNSYDTDAPLDEAGNPTEKYFIIQSVIKKHCPEAFTEEPKLIPARDFGRVNLAESAPLLENLQLLGRSVDSVTAEPMEYYGQDFGFILYSTDLSYLPMRICSLKLENLADRAQVFVDGVSYGTIYRNDASQSIQVPTGKIQILVENMGRFNSGMGVHMHFWKGLTGVVMDGCRRLYHWTVTPLPFDDLSALPFGSLVSQGNMPCFHRGVFEVDEPADTWLRVPYGRKGQVWLNGFNLGRYWQEGPQYALYVPAPLLKQGRNELVILELHGLRGEPIVELIDHYDRAPSIALPLN